MSTTVVLGWDGIDPEILDKWDLDGFGSHRCAIDSIANPELGEPHTSELWPTLISGVPPAEHGIRAATVDEGVAWESQTLQLLSRLASGVIPQRVRTEIGERLRAGGAGTETITAEEFRKRGIPSVFEGRQSRAINIPNYLTPADERYRRGEGRLEIWRSVLSTRTDEDGGGLVYEPEIPIPELDERLLAECTRQLGYVRAAAQRQNDIIWVWLRYLDTVGHIAPAVDESGWKRRHYETAERLTCDIRDWLPDGDRVVCVSDHGLQEGHHTEEAVLATDEPVDSVDSVCDVAPWIDGITPSRQPLDPTPVRDSFDSGEQLQDASPADVRDHLENLGYIEA